MASSTLGGGRADLCLWQMGAAPPAAAAAKSGEVLLSKSLPHVGSRPAPPTQRELMRRAVAFEKARIQREGTRQVGRVSRKNMWGHADASKNITPLNHASRLYSPKQIQERHFETAMLNEQHGIGGGW